jgi:hypothetical protein
MIEYRIYQATKKPYPDFTFLQEDVGGDVSGPERSKTGRDPCR